MGRKWPLSAAASAVVAALLLTIAGSIVTTATNWGGPKDPGKTCGIDPVTSQCVGEGTFHGVIIESSVLNYAAEPALEDQIRWSIANHDAVSDVYMVELAPDDSVVDVKVRLANYGANGWWASGACEYSGSPTVYGGSEANRDRWCRAQVFRWNTYYVGNWATDAQQRKVACHEFGHTLGLRHTSSSQDPDYLQSCMRDPATNASTNSITQHDKNHLNARY
jgi:predicted Zn-dependent protease